MDTPEMDEPLYCAEGHRYFGGHCLSCEFEYDQGGNDADNYHTALLVGGEELAAQMELEAEYGYMGG